MRLSMEKIGRVAEVVVDALLEKEALALQRPGRAGRAALVAAVRDLIRDDLSIEDEIDAEVERVLDSYSRELVGTEREILFRKTKEEIANRRGYVL
ncbi:MAG: DUF507 family protein [Chloroflexia bacterium]|nr:DUF507 family protein [Chloroflexia bacterium]